MEVRPSFYLKALLTRNGSCARIILFLNKTVVFKSEVPKILLEKYFPECTAEPDTNKAQTSYYGAPYKPTGHDLAYTYTSHKRQIHPIPGWFPRPSRR